MTDRNSPFQDGVTNFSEAQSADSRELLNGDDYEELLRELQRRGLIGIFLFLIEAHRPLRGVANHLMTMSFPLLNLFFGASKVSLIQRIMADDESFSQFTERLESMHRDTYGGS